MIQAILAIPLFQNFDFKNITLLFLIKDGKNLILTLKW
jgi:hypothetical protein